MDIRDLAWIGDAILALYARQWILADPESRPLNRTEMFILFTSNNFLSALGQPTEVEARIGQIYRDEGLQPAFTHIEQHILPLYLKRLANQCALKRGGRK